MAWIKLSNEELNLDKIVQIEYSINEDDKSGNGIHFRLDSANSGVNKTIYWEFDSAEKVKRARNKINKLTKSKSIELTMDSTEVTADSTETI